jgi:hypothetical protein
MNSIIARLAYALFYAAFPAAIFFLSPGSPRPQEGVDVSFTMTEASLSLHEPIFVEFSLHNSGAEVIRLDLGSNRERNFTFAITKDGARTAQARLAEAGGMGRGGKISLSPNETYRQRLLLNKWYQIAEPGEYVVQARLVDSIHTESGVPIKSPDAQEIRVSVGSRDPERLGRVCAKLEEVTLGSSDYETRAEAALALSYVRDPVAVPHLGEVLKRGGVLRGVAIEGLVRVGTPEAVEILRSNLKTPDQELKVQIKAALEEIKSGVQRQITD